ncbi:MULTISPECIES: phosphate ABC transporter substrate-binding protein PstS [unclassified Nocardioides]|uniref:phosphate ABC transporter substrate-binding protein PstS n=1 Tax=unclassified Nocardioides TaxID=2615069 RepID=UPI0006F27718|nr:MULTISPECIES: phosphate ABC transporter substrate-binding protein PstS [unclassified Nocardioides]KQY56954.1 phosphate ABC transporter substrate-binding protein [Nocardioides sp. Root140]KQZ66846.1 phosphate ABC transporter substrate-binding protein [Nocardioides sp. Root151]KRF13076.1 phosphate ABC transporter substrate-binding protein [Nocardioides sp. Soil796]
MKRTSFRSIAAPAIATIAVFSLAACGGGNDSNTDLEGDAGDTSVYEGLSGTLAGGGASSQGSAQDAWIAGFSTVASGVTVTYDPQGSGAGRENFISGGYKFAGTDAYLSDEEGELTEATKTCGTAPIQIPNYVSPIAVIFNVDGVENLNLAPDVLADIFAGKIKKWNDPRIVADNKDEKLPNADIRPVHRSDESGTTENFTDYLDAVAKKNWTAGVVETWPKQFGGEGAKGTDGVVKSVTDGEKNAIGYADASKAGDLGVAKIKVGDAFVEPSADAAAKILEVSPEAEGAGDTAMIYDLDHTTTEDGVYPIVLTSYLLACQKYDDEATAKQVKGYLTYILSDQGQTIGSEEAGSAPLSDDLRTRAQEIVAKIGS